MTIIFFNKRVYLDYPQNWLNRKIITVTHVNNTLSNSKVKDETALIDIIVELF